MKILNLINSLKMYCTYYILLRNELTDNQTSLVENIIFSDNNNINEYTSEAYDLRRKILYRI